MNLWIVSRECEGIMGAGGVKNVTFSLCNEFQKLKKNVTLFIPLQKTTSKNLLVDFKQSFLSDICINHCGKTEKINYCKAVCKNSGFNIIFIDNPVFFEKEDVYTYTLNEQKINPENIKGTGHKDSLYMDSLFCKAVSEYLLLCNENELPDIIHCQDASTAILPAFIKDKQKNKNIKTVVTIHNAGPAYHHYFNNIDEAAWFTDLNKSLLESSLNKDKVEPFLIAYNSGAYLTTVSKTYAQELTDPSNDIQTEGLSTIFNNMNISIKGITNGIDLESYNPLDKLKSLLPFEFDTKYLNLNGKFECRSFFIDKVNNKNVPVSIKVYGNLINTNKDSIFICYHGRITQQKGINVLLDSIDSITNNFKNVYFIICGQGQIDIEETIINKVNEQNGKLIFLNGYDKAFTRLSNAVSDFIILPSFFEPCGLEDYIAQIFGTIPVANKTGGLNKIIDYETGFLYSPNTSNSLITKLSEIITIKIHNPKLIDKIIKKSFVNIEKNYVWKKVIKNDYLPFFKEILQKK